MHRESISKKRPRTELKKTLKWQLEETEPSRETEKEQVEMWKKARTE